MSEEKTKGVSLRTKRKGRPAISGPKQISGPVRPVDVVRNDGKLSYESSPPPQRLQAGGKVRILMLHHRITFTNALTDVKSRKATLFYKV